MRGHVGSLTFPSAIALLLLSVPAVLVAACGSRTGLVSNITIYGTLDGGSEDGAVIIPDEAGAIYEGGILDVATDCPFPTVCEPADPGYVYKCGKRVIQCSSLETCENTCQGEDCGAQCVNPCLDTLGQNTSNGCNFYPVEMDTGSEVNGACYAVFIINQWTTGQPARIAVDLGGTPLPIEQFARVPVGTGLNISYEPFSETNGLAQGQVAILFLSRDPAAAMDQSNGGTNPRTLANCPPGVTPAIVGDAALHGTGIGTAFHIATNVPVVAYQMLPYGGGSARVTGATLLLPTNVWDTNYVAANAYDTWELEGSDRGEPTLAIVAQKDETHVTIAPTSTLLPSDDGGLPGSPQGAPVTYTINQGQYLQFSQEQQLSGSPIVADAPIAVIGGSTLMDVPLVQIRRADAAEQMLPPVRALGSEYVAVRYRSRPVGGTSDGGWDDGGDVDAGVVTLPDGGTEEIVPWRIVGAVNGTVLSYDPARPAGAPTQLSAKQMVEFYATGPFVIRSQDSSHPFYLASYMTGGNSFGGDGDPEFVNVVPPAQFLPRYTFFTDPTYPETNLVIVRSRDATSGAMPDVVLDCAGVLGGWAPVDLADRFEFTRLDLSTGDFVGQNGCDNGVHAIAGTFAGDAGAAPAFGVTVWGWGNDITLAQDDETNPLSTRWVSYGYPAGANFSKLNDVVVPAQ